MSAASTPLNEQENYPQLPLLSAPSLAINSADDDGVMSGPSPEQQLLIAPPELPAVGGDLAVQNEIFLHNSHMEAVRQKYALRPKSTSLAYAPIQRRFTEWCDSRQFVDGQLATEQKLIVFLQTEVIDKGCRNRERPYMLNALKLHVAAVTDLWKQQVDLGINPHSKPRSANVQAMLNAYSMQTYKRNRDSYTDRGTGSIFDGYNTEGMLKIARATLSRPDSYGDRIQGLLDFLLGNYMLLRGNNRRNIELADLYLLPYENEGPTKCNVLVILLSNGKTNQHGRVDHAGAMRNQEVMICPFFMLALQFFFRFHVDQEPFPVFRSNQHWFDTKLFFQY
ncbi:hypothetical protein V1525DRAFT_392259, partial [Lipomyces kononenkoae]